MPYQPFLICSNCGVTRHRSTRKVPVNLACRRGRFLDHYKLMFQCERCGEERVYGTKRAEKKSQVLANA